MADRQLTSAPGGHILTHAAVWTPDGRWIVYDVRSTPDGGVFDGTRIERVDVLTGDCELLYRSRHGGCCGVVTCSPVDDRVVFIVGPERPDATWSYGPSRRQGMIVTPGGEAEPLDARDLRPPFTPGALRGGSHVHVFSGDGRLVSFTYEDEILQEPSDLPARQANARCVGVSVTGRPVRVPPGHPRNHDGGGFSVVVTTLDDDPPAGSDQICRGFEDAWIGRAGYLRSDGSRQRYALAFQGLVKHPGGGIMAEAFVVDLPDDPRLLEQPGAGGPLAGTPVTRPCPPAGVIQRRLSFTADRPHPGIQGPRHWLRSSPDGGHVACLMRDDRGIVQLVTLPTTGGPPEPRSRDPWHVASAFSWSPDGGRIAYVADGSVMTLDLASGTTRRLTATDDGPTAPRPEACVFSPDGRRIAYLRTLPGAGGPANQICVVDAD